MFFERHIFFCTNRRDDGRACCEDHGAKASRDYVKERVKALGLAAPGGVRVNSAGCLGRCALGPTAVVYPEGVWYSYRNREDLDEIVDRHLAGGEVVDRLRI